MARGRVVAQLVREGWRPPPLTDQQARRLLDDMQRIGSDRRLTLELTAHEQRVLWMVADGMSGSEIADTLHRSRHTVVAYQKQIRRKLGARNMAHAVAIMMRKAA